MHRLKPARDLEGLRRRVLAPAGEAGSGGGDSFTPDDRDERNGAVPVTCFAPTDPLPTRLPLPLVSLVDALNGETCEKLLKYLDGVGTARLGSTCRDLRAVASSQALWQERCFREWGESGWGLSCMLVEENGERISLGDRVAGRMRERSGLIVDQLTLNKIMDHVLPQRSQESMSVVEISPFDGLPLEQTITSLSLERGRHQEGEEMQAAVGGVDGTSLREARAQKSEAGNEKHGMADMSHARWTSGSGIDWKRTYALLATMQATCEISAARTAAAAPSSGSTKGRAAIGCLDMLAKYGRLRISPGASVTAFPDSPRAAASDGRDRQQPREQGWQLLARPTARGGFRPLALVVSSNSSSGRGAAACTPMSPKRWDCGASSHGAGGQRLSAPDGQVVRCTGRNSLSRPFHISVEFPGLPDKVVAEVRGSDGRLEEEVVAVSGSGHRLLALAAAGGAGGALENLEIWVIESAGGKGSRRGGAGVGGSGRAGVCREVLWVGTSLSLSHVLTAVHLCPPWAPNCVLPAPRVESRARADRHPLVWMRVQIRDAARGEAGVMWRGGWRHVKGWCEDAIARPENQDVQMVTYSPQRYASPLCDGPLQVAFARDQASRPKAAGDVVFEDVVWVDFAVGICSSGMPGPERPDEWWSPCASAPPVGGPSDMSSDMAHLLWHRSSLCRVEYDSPAQPAWDDGIGAGRGGQGSRLGGGFGDPGRKAVMASRAHLKVQQQVASPSRAPSASKRGDVHSLKHFQSWSASAIHQPAASRAPVEAAHTRDAILMCEMDIELVAQGEVSNSSRAWRVENLRCTIPQKV